MKDYYQAGLRSQFAYGALCILWNLVVIIQTRLDLSPIGPTGSWAVIFGALVLLTILFLAQRHGWSRTYLFTSALVGTVALLAIISGLTSRAESWPSVYWQLVGLSINALGVSTLVIVLFSRWQTSSKD